MLIPFVGGAYTARSTNLNAQTCINLFPVVDNQDAKSVLSLAGTPGLDLFATMEDDVGVCVRAAYSVSNKIYAVVNANVYVVTSGGVATLLGTISTSSGFVSMNDNSFEVIIADGTVNGYLITIATDVLAAISDADYPAISSVTFQDGFFVGVEKDTRRFYISALYNGDSWDPLDVATVEGRSSTLLSAVSNVQDLWFFGERSTEVYYNSGNADFPFERIQGAIIDTGTAAVASAIKINGQLYWLTDDRQVCRNQSYNKIEFISTPEIDYQLSTYTIVSDAIGYTYVMDGHHFYVLAFPSEGKTWAYDTLSGFWHEWQSYLGGATPWGRHRSNCAVQLGQYQIVGDYGNGLLYKLNLNTYSDNGHTIRRRRAAQTINKEKLNLIHHSFELDIEPGVGVVATQAEVHCHLSGDAVSTFTVDSGGSGYLDNPSVMFYGGGGSGAVATATASGGAVTSITLLNGGSGYTSAPTMVIVGGGYDPQAVLDWSDDGGHTWSNQYWKSLGKIGEYKKRLKWNRLGMSKNRVYRVTISDPVKVSILAAYAEIEECKI
jgi:hypothetical protein